MPRFFIKSSDISIDSESCKRITICGSDAVHISRVLRMKPGERLVVCDSHGIEYDTVILSAGEKCVLEVISEKISLNEPPYRAVIYQALVKGDKFETVIQKGTELGAAVFVPVMTKRCVARLEAKDAARKVERWQRIAEEAAKQCGRGGIPEVMFPVPLKDAVSRAEGRKLFCYEGEGTVPMPEALSSADVPDTVSVFIGPEGGFAEEEVLLAKDCHAEICGLGRRILRTETASAFVLSCLSFRYELCRTYARYIFKI